MSLLNTFGYFLDRPEAVGSKGSQFAQAGKRRSRIVQCFVRKYLSTKTLVAEERLLFRRPLSISAMISESFMLRRSAISLRPAQNSSSSVILVLAPATTIERFKTGEFMRVRRQTELQYKSEVRFG